MQNKSTLDTCLIKTIELLNATNVDYFLIGGFAVSILGSARMTQDIDILIFIKKENINNFVKKATKHGFTYNKAEAYKSIQLRGVFKLFYENIHVDFIMGQMPFELEALKRKKKITLFGKTVFLPTPEDLILLKLISGREKDILDIKNIIVRYGNKLDIIYLKNWAKVISDDFENFRIYNLLKRFLDESK